MTAVKNSGGRPRDPEVGPAILKATQDLLAEHGYERMSVDAVAERAKAGKAAIYRRWATKSDLAVAAVWELQMQPSIPETGSLRGDLLAAAQHFINPDTRAQIVLASLIAELPRNAALREAAYQAIGAPAARGFDAVVRRWQDAGTIPADIDAPMMSGVIPAFAFRQAALRRKSLTQDELERLVDSLVMPALTRR